MTGQPHPRQSKPRCLTATIATATILLSAQVFARVTPSNEPSAAPQTAGQSSPATSSISIPLPKGQKLILNDGTFQIVREYRREGDVVRYYSVERSDWEEIPATLIDWDATGKAETSRLARDKELAQKIRDTDTAARLMGLNPDRSYEVRPGLILPDEDGLYTLDGMRIRKMEQDKSELHLDKARTFERVASGVPLIPAKQHLEIPGKRAKVRLASNDPEFYFRPAGGREPRIQLLRAEVQGDKRALETVTTNVAGQVGYKNREYSLQSWEAAEGLYRFTLSATLDPGEYALVETTEEGQSAYIWDFGVEGKAGGKSAPANSSAK